MILRLTNPFIDTERYSAENTPSVVSHASGIVSEPPFNVVSEISIWPPNYTMAGLAHEIVLVIQSKTLSSDHSTVHFSMPAEELYKDLINMLFASLLP